MWKSRDHFPVISKIKDLQFDSEQLLKDYFKILETKKYDSLGKEYDGLCKTHNKLPSFFLKTNENTDAHASYSQLALSEWDENYSLDKRPSRSGTIWDRTYAKKNILADERFYGKPIDGIPSYLASVLKEFRPYLHRCRFAKLNPHCEVKPHIDYDTTYSIRLHIPILTNDKCINGGISKDNVIIETALPADGTVWFVNQGVKHWAKNDGDTPRVHLILSIDSQKFIQSEEEI